MTEWAVGTALAVSLLIVLVLLLRVPVARYFGANAAYALWAAPLIRLVLPPLPVAQTAVSATPLGRAAYHTIIAHPLAMSSHMDLLLAVWITGAAGFLALQLVRHQRFVASVLRNGRPLLIHGIDCDVIQSSAVDGPMATGLIHRLIFVPADFGQRFTDEQQAFALLHEQLHHRRADIWASAAALIVTAMLWFNPLAHLALRAFHRDMEAACDASVLSSMGPAAAPGYAETILRSATYSVPRSLCALTSIDELKGRLTMLKMNHGNGRRLAGLFVAGAMVVTGVAIAAPSNSSKAVKEIKEVKVIRTIGGGGNDAGDAIADVKTCPGEKIQAETNSEPAKDKKQKSTIVLCGEKGASGKELADMIDGAVKRIQNDQDMGSSDKAALIAQLRAKSQELRAH